MRVCRGGFAGVFVSGGVDACLYEGRAGGWVVAGELLYGLLYGRLSDAVGGCVGDTAGGGGGLIGAEDLEFQCL